MPQQVPSPAHIKHRPNTWTETATAATMMSAKPTTEKMTIAARAPEESGEDGSVLSEVGGAVAACVGDAPVERVCVDENGVDACCVDDGVELGTLSATRVTEAEMRTETEDGGKPKDAATACRTRYLR